MSLNAVLCDVFWTLWRVQFVINEHKKPQSENSSFSPLSVCVRAENSCSLKFLLSSWLLICIHPGAFAGNLHGSLNSCRINLQRRWINSVRAIKTWSFDYILDTRETDMLCCGEKWDCDSGYHERRLSLRWGIRGKYLQSHFLRALGAFLQIYTWCVRAGGERTVPLRGSGGAGDERVAQWELILVVLLLKLRMLIFPYQPGV